MSVVRSDTFTRANVASGFGTATDGNTWTIQSGDHDSVSSNEGLISGSTASTFATLGASLAGGDAEGLLRWNINNSASTSGLILRWTDSNNYYLARYDGAGHIAFYKKVAGTTTTVGSYALAPTAGSYYWTRFRVQGSSISIRTWQDGSGEPSTWNYTTTDTGLAGTGGSANLVGLYGYGYSPGNHYDSYSVNDLSAISLTSSVPSGEGVSGSLSVVPHLVASVPSGATVSGTLTVSAFLGTVPSGSGAHGALHKGDALAGAVPTGSAVSGQLRVSGAGTGIGDLSVTTKSQTWSGPAGSPGTETDITYTDAGGGGWSLGIIPGYGGANISSRYDVTNNVQGTNQTNLTTSTADGHIHWLEQNPSGGFAGSEDKPFTLTEQAPVGTPYRRYYTGTFGPDANGFNWAVWTCIYPGDPGFVATRFDLINPSTSAISLATSDSLEIALIGGMQVADSTWNYLNGGYGTLAGGNITPWPVASASGNPIAADPDYVYIVPAAGGSSVIGQVTVKQKPTSAFSPAWASPQLSVLVNANRLKIKLFGTQTSFPASTTSTVYLLDVLRRNLTAADAAAIAADYINHGTPSANVGSFTSFSYDEAAYVFAASNNNLSASLDLSPAHVTTRFKPRYKITGWTASGAPSLTWGGQQLVAGTDYRYYNDTTNSVLYLHLYFDVVAANALAGQRVNANLVVAPAAVISLAASTPSGQGASCAGLVITRPLAAMVPSGGAVSGSLTPQTFHLSALVPSGAGVSGSLPVSRPLHGLIPSGSGASGSLVLAGSSTHLVGQVPSGSAASTLPLSVTRPLGGLVPHAAPVSGSPLVVKSLAGVVSSTSSASVGLLSVTRALGGLVPSSVGVSGSLQVTAPFSGVVPSGAAAHATLTKTDSLHGSVLDQGAVSGSLSVGQAASHLAGVVPSGQAVTGSLLVSHGSTGLVPSGAGVSGGLIVTKALTSLVPSGSAVGGTLQSPLGSRLFAGSIPSGSGVSGTLSLTVALRASVPSGGAVAGSLVVSKFYVSVPSGGAAQGLLAVTRPLIGAVPGGQGCAATLAVTRSLAGVVPSGPGCAALLTIARHLSGAVPSGSSAQGLLGFFPGLSATVPSGSAAGGSLRLIRLLVGAVPSGSGVVGALSGVQLYIPGALSVTDAALAILTLTDFPTASLALADVFAQ